MAQRNVIPDRTPEFNEGRPAIVVGGDALALKTAQELCVLRGYRVVVLWHGHPEFVRAVESMGAVFIPAHPDTKEGLERASIRHAVAILALSPDDQLNLHTALLARDANPHIRIVLRQFNRTLAHKLEQNLPNCSVLSLAWHSAATYAAAGVDPSCFFALQFPQPDGPLIGFAKRTAAACGIGGNTVANAERALGARILAVDGRTDVRRNAKIPDHAELVICSKVSGLLDSAPRPAARMRTGIARKLVLLSKQRRRHRPRFNPILARLAAATFAAFAIGTMYFHSVIGNTWLDAIYFVVTTMTTTGYGDLTPNRSSPYNIVAAMMLMLSGIILTGLFIAFGASLLTRVHWVALQGLRPVHRRGHIIVCGAGSIGSGVIDLLLGLGKPLVVIELSPDTTLVEQAREHRFDLLTGDASRDTTLDLCNLDAAHSLIALTNGDTLNLEIALGARARNPNLPIVLRIADASFAESIARHFQFETTFSAAALAAPAFVGLSQFPGSRGRVEFGGQEFAIAEIGSKEDLPRAVAANAIPIALARSEEFEVCFDFDGRDSAGRQLVLIPISSENDQDALGTAAERVRGH
jgi:voltage-gated potassium channel Kch